MNEFADQSARVSQRVRELHDDHDGLRGAEELLSARAALMQDQIADFRNAMALVGAKVVAARTSAVAGEALDALRDALTYVELVVGEAARPGAARRKAMTDARSASTAAPSPSGSERS